MSEEKKKESPYINTFNKRAGILATVALTIGLGGFYQAKNIMLDYHPAANSLDDISQGLVEPAEGKKLEAMRDDIQTPLYIGAAGSTIGFGSLSSICLNMLWRQRRQKLTPKNNQP